MPRDNLLNSACLELFEFVRRENIKPIITHVVENYRDKLKNVTYVDTFQNLILRFDQMQGYGADGDSSLFSQEDVTPPRSQVNGQRWQGIRETDAAEDDYFNRLDDEDEVWPSMYDGTAEAVSQRRAELTSDLRQEKYAEAMVITPNGSVSPNAKPLVDYPDDDDDEGMGMKAEPDSTAQRNPLQSKTNQAGPEAGPAPEVTMSPVSPLGGRPPPERLSEKRRREEDEDEDELVKLSSGPKRRSSSVGVVPGGGGVGFLGRRKSVTAGTASTSPSSGSEKGHSPVVPSSPKAKGTRGRQIAISFGTSSRAKAANKKQADAQKTNESNNEGQSVSNNGHSSDAVGSSNGGSGDTEKGADDGSGGSS